MATLQDGQKFNFEASTHGGKSAAPELSPT